MKIFVFSHVETVIVIKFSQFEHLKFLMSFNYEGIYLSWFFWVTCSSAQGLLLILPLESLLKCAARPCGLLGIQASLTAGKASILPFVVSFWPQSTMRVLKKLGILCWALCNMSVTLPKIKSSAWSYNWPKKI